MADGYILTGWASFPLDTLSANVPGTHELPQGTRGGWLAAAIISGTFTDTQPISIRSVNYSGQKMRTFFDDYYNRIHVLPTLLDFGTVSGVETLETTVWNAWLTAATLETITGVTAEGTELFGPALPAVLNPLATLTLQVEASADGPATIDATYELDFGAHGFHILHAIGTAAKLWLWPPNWRTPVTVAAEYRTDTITSRSAREQRRALRNTPRRAFGFLASVDGASLRALQRLLTAWQNRAVLLPDPVRKATVTDGMPVGADSLDVEAVPDWLTADATVVLVSGEQMATRKVESVDGLTITFTTVSAETWPAGAALRPALAGLLNMQLTGRAPTNNVFEVEVNFEVDPASETVPASAAAETFNGREVFVLKPNWGETPSTTHLFPREQIDYGRGRRRNYYPIDFPTRLRRMAFLGRDVSEIEDIARFFDRMKGQRGEFYMPTGENDLPLRSAPVSGSNFLRVIGPETAETYVDSSVYTAVCLLKTDGTRLYRLVTDAYTVDDVTGNDSVIEFGAVTWVADIPLDEIVMVSWMPVWRHSGDRLVLEYVTDEVAQTQMTLRSLEDLPAEAA